MRVSDETTMTEIVIQPDGRVFCFGLSREVAEILYSLCPEKHPLTRSLDSSAVSGQTTTHESASTVEQ